MKPILIVLFTLGLFLMMDKCNSQTKHALIFAVGNYPKANGWPAISSLRDAGLVDSALIRQGFMQENITTRTDAQVTPAGIQQAFNELISNVKTGDAVLVHVSSHGEQVADDNNDEADGLDETIVTFNAGSPLGFKDNDGKINIPVAEYNRLQADYFRDDVFGMLIDKMREKLGKDGDVLVFMDLCHSGTGLRGSAKVRGGQPALVPAGFNPTVFAAEDSSGFSEKPGDPSLKKPMATYIAITAARAEELDFEITDENGDGIGSLSFAESKVLQNLDSATTYRSLFSKIEAIMHEKTPGQHPMMEGNGADRLLFGGKFIAQKKMIELAALDGNTVVLKAGRFSGLDTGAVIALYPAGTADPLRASMLASGKIITAGAYTSEAYLSNSIDIQHPSLIWAFVTRAVYNIQPVCLQFQQTSGIQHPGYSDAEITSLKKSLRGLPIVSFNGPPELLLVKGSLVDSIKIAANGYLFCTLNKTDLPVKLGETLQRYAQYKFLTNLEINDPGVSISVTLVPYSNGNPDTNAVNQKIVKGIYEYREGDKLVVWVKNKGEEDVYINIVDIQPDGIINAVLPYKSKGIGPGNLKIPRRTEHLFSNYPITISRPYGTEIFKIFASKELIDVEDLANSAGSGTRGSFSALESLLKKSYNIRGGEPQDVSGKEGSTYNLLFSIVPKK